MATAKPLRRFIIKDVNGVDVDVVLRRAHQRTTVDFRYTSPMSAQRYGFFVSDGGDAPRVVHVPTGDDVAYPRAAPADIVIAPHDIATRFHVRVVLNRLADPLPSGARPSAVQVWRQYYGDGDNGYWDDTDFVPFDQKTAALVLLRVMAFHEHFASGTAAKAGRESKEAKLGRPFQLARLQVWRNPVFTRSIDPGDEVLNVTCYPDSGTDTLKLTSALDIRVGESAAPRMARPPLFTSMQSIMQRFNPRPRHGEVLGYEGRLVLAYPLGMSRYDTGLSTFPTLRIGLYAREHELWALEEALHDVQQGGSGFVPGAPYKRADPNRPNFPLEVDVELRTPRLDQRHGDRTADVVEGYRALAEYDGRDTKGIARVRLTPLAGRITQSHSFTAQLWTRKHSHYGDTYQPRISYVAQVELQQGDVRLRSDDGEGRNRVKNELTNVYLPAREAARLLVALDYRMDRGLRGLSPGSTWLRVPGQHG